MPIDEKNVAEIPVLYANSIRLGLGFTDIKLFFGEAIPAPPPDTMPTGQALLMGTGKHVDRICIALSPDIVPAIAEGLMKAVKLYEAQFGPLRKPPQMPSAATQPEAK